MELEKYLSELNAIHSSGAGVKETSYYPALSNLLNDVGKQLKPKVHCIVNIKNQGAGIPDGGFFTPNQLLPNTKAQLQQGPVPERGALEVKGAKEDVRKVARSPQVVGYLGRYDLALVTNLRDFLLVKNDPSAPNGIVELESYQLAKDEKDFWALVSKDSHRMARAHSARFVDFLKRVMLYEAPLSEPKDVAWFLASYAREARERIEKHGNVPALRGLREAFEQALGITFEGDEGEQFFRSTLAQTLFYGIFSAWVLWSKENSAGTPSGAKSVFRLRDTPDYLSVPMIEQLFSQIASRSMLGQLDLAEVLKWTEDVLNRIDVSAFFKNFDADEAVQYFYEPFLEAFDPELRKRYGVWYTPPEIVRYMVERVDTILREDLGIPDGFADESVYVLDPCTGTGSYLLEVARRIEKTLQDQGTGDLAGLVLKKALLNRLFGFELLPAPFVVAHLKLGLLLQSRNTPLDASTGERTSVYLTNALTGWQQSKDKPPSLPFPGFDEEMDAARKVKQKEPILVVLGNPPYDAFAGISPEQEEGLVEPYKESLVTKWGVKKFNLDDLYIRFFRLAERRIAEGKPGRGVLCYISNFSYLSGASFTVMRERLLNSFDSIWIDSLNGDSRETGKRTPWGTSDPSAFSTPQNKAGIRVGTAISLMARKGSPPEKEPDTLGARRAARAAITRFREFWGTKKREELFDSLSSSDLNVDYENVLPTEANRFSFRPSAAGVDYLSWPTPVDLSLRRPFNGPIERRSLALISMEREPLASRVEAYFDPAVSDEKIKNLYPSLMMTGNRIVGSEARKTIRRKFSYDDSRIVRYPFKPFDRRYCYLENLRPLFSEPSPELLKQRFPGNEFFVTRDAADKSVEGSPFYFSPLVCDYHLLSGEARHFPKYVHPATPKKGKKNTTQDALLQEDDSEATRAPVANLSDRARDYLSSLGFADPDSDEQAASSIWLHALAIGYSPLYLEENHDGIRDDWPRIPLPDDKSALISSASLGRELSALLDVENPVPGVSTGSARSELREIGVIRKEGGGNLSLTTGDLALRSGWGHKNAKGVVMPGSGRVEKRDYTSAERKSIDAGAIAVGLSPQQAYALLGNSTCDVYLNASTYWGNVPTEIWEYTVGGYQVVKKWLSYREEKVLGRSLEIDEVREVTGMIRRIAVILLLGKRLDDNYAAVKSVAYTWPPPIALTRL